MKTARRARMLTMGALALVASSVGCKSNVDRAAEMAEAVCACTDFDCADAASKKGADEMLKHLPRSLSKDDKEKIEASKKKASECWDKLAEGRSKSKKKASKGEEE